LLSPSPESGSGGGQIVATGTPKEIAANPRSHTGHWLAPVLHLPASKPEPKITKTETKAPRISFEKNAEENGE
jgi:excinuclease ABC subunit A